MGDQYIETGGWNMMYELGCIQTLLACFGLQHDILILIPIPIKQFPFIIAVQIFIFDKN